MLLVGMPVVCRGSRYNFVTGSQYNQKCTNSKLCHLLPQYCNMKLPLILCLDQETVFFIKPAVHVELNGKVMENLWTKNGWQEMVIPNLQCS